MRPLGFTVNSQKLHEPEAHMKKLIIGLFLTLCAASMAYGQSTPVNPVTTMPYGVLSHNDSGTIAATNTFQSIWTASTNNRGRAGCTVQNNGTNAMYVFFGPIASATIGKSVKLAAGLAVNCVGSGIVLQDQVSITGTSGDAFFAAQQ